MPPETPTPCRAKLMRPSSCFLFLFAETGGDQLLDRLHRFGLVRPVRLDHDARAFGRGEHHDSHDAFSVDAPSVAAYPHFALELTGNLRELRRSPGMQPEAVY